MKNQDYTYIPKNTVFSASHKIYRIFVPLLILALIIIGCSGSKGQNNDSADSGTYKASISKSQADTAVSSDYSKNEDNQTLDQAAANKAAADLADELYTDSDWVTFLLVCNEGMNNTGSNVDNTQMCIAMNPTTGKIRLMSLTWDTFIKYDGYDIPQVINMAYRNNGPEEVVKVFDSNFDMSIDRFMSLNFLNLAYLIDDYGGVKVDITRAERNALNGLVASKKRDLQKMAGDNLLSQYAMDLLEKEYHLSEFGHDTLLNGLQAVSYGWLQYDSVYNCCERELKIVSGLFHSISEQINKEVVFYTNETGVPENTDNRRVINLDDISDDDRAYLMQILAPVTQTSYNNLSEEEEFGIVSTLARSAFSASREGVDIFVDLDQEIFPLEAKQPYDNVAGIKGHIIDYDNNSTAMKQFLYKNGE